MGKCGNNSSIFELSYIKKTFSMTNLIGQYDCKADAKGRVSLPVGLKTQLLPVLEKGFVIKRSVFQQCLELYPREEYDELVKRVRAKSRVHRKYDAFLRNFVAGTQVVTIEENGRLQIPKNLVEFAGIAKEVVLSSAIDRIEIWDKSKYESILLEGQNNYADLAEEIFADDV